MKRMIEGKSYNTETAEQVCDIPCQYYGNDFRHHNTKLYITRNGTFFLAGKGGAASVWGERIANELRAGEGIRVLSQSEARAYMEQADCDEEDYKRVGLET